MDWVFRKAMKPMITTQRRVQGPSLKIIVLKEKEKNQMEAGFTRAKQELLNSPYYFSNRNPAQ